MVRRIVLGGAVLVVLVSLVMLFASHATGSVELREAGPVRDAVQTKRAGADESLRQAIVASATWDDLGEPVPEKIGCHLKWDAASDEAVLAHVSRCGGSSTLDSRLVDALKAMSLNQPAELPGAPSTSWMRSLRGHSNWLELQGTPFDFVTPDPTRRTMAEMPALDCTHALLLSKLALAESARADALEDGVTDVVAFARALLGMPSSVGNACGIRVLNNARVALLVAGKSSEALPTEAALQRLSAARSTVGTLWHPWVSSSSRAALTPALTLHGRCLSAMEGLGYADLAPVIERRYPGWTAEFASASASCPSSLFKKLSAAHGSGAAWPRALLQTQWESPSLVVDTARTLGLRLSGTRREGMLERYLERFELQVAVDLPDAGVPGP